MRSKAVASAQALSQTEQHAAGVACRCPQPEAPGESAMSRLLDRHRPIAHRLPVLAVQLRPLPTTRCWPAWPRSTSRRSRVRCCGATAIARSRHRHARSADGQGRGAKRGRHRRWRSSRSTWAARRKNPCCATVTRADRGRVRHLESVRHRQPHASRAGHGVAARRAQPLRRKSGPADRRDHLPGRPTCASR